MGYADITRVADATRFHLRSAHQILSALFPDQPEFLKGLDEILQRFEFGLSAEALALAKLRVRLARGQCLTLVSAGVRSQAQLDALTIERLRVYVGQAMAELYTRFDGAVRFSVNCTCSVNSGWCHERSYCY